MTGAAALYSRLASGTTTTCRAWDLETAQGVTFGFTDHDVDLEFEGVVYRAGGGMTARAFEQSSGLSIDNSEAMGVLSHESITEEDIRKGLYDGALVRVWLVNWSAPEERVLQFSGSLGEIERTMGGFRAELLGLSEALNKERGHVFQKTCSAVLGDQRCRFDVGQQGYSVDVLVSELLGSHRVDLGEIGSFSERWFERGVLTVTAGSEVGFSTLIKNDRLMGARRVIETWDMLPSSISSGDQLRLQAGCDRLKATCRAKFDNIANFRGFPTIPGEDWLMSYPKADGTNNGGKL